VHDIGVAVEMLRKLAGGRALSADEAYLLAREMLSGGLSDVQIAAALAAMRCRGETAEEVAGFVRFAREAAVRVPLRVEAIDTAGTGGDGARTINLSTAAAVVAAAAGARVLKHGNKSASGFFGSADFMEAAGYNLNVGPERAAEMVERLGFAFVFAPRYHPAFARVAPVRRQLPFRTVFNIVGPLANPGLVRRQLVGVSDRRLLDIVAGVASAVMDSALVVHGSGIDEVSAEAPTEVAEVRRGRVECYIVEPEDFGIPRTPVPRVSTREEALAVALAGLRGEHREAEAAIAVNAAAALYVAGIVSDLRDGYELAVKAVREGAARAKLEEAVRASWQ
jgi:anthranilate phosphoribosyltransferase